MGYKLSQWTPLVRLQAATALLATAGVLSAVIPLSVPAAVGGRALLALPAVIASALIRGKRIWPSRAGPRLLPALCGVLLAIHWMAYFHSVRVSSVAIATLTLFTFPVMTALVEPLLFRESYRAHSIANALLVLVGVLLVSEVWEAEHAALVGVGWGLLSAFVFTTRNLLSRALVRQNEDEQIMSIQLLVVTVLLAPPLISAEWYAFGVGDWLALLALGVAATGIGHLFLLTTLGKMGAASASIGFSLNPVYASLYALLFLEEIPSIWVTGGGLCILAAVIHETVKAGKEGRSSGEPSPGSPAATGESGGC